MNKGYEITARVPSIMIAGEEQFPRPQKGEAERRRR